MQRWTLKDSSTVCWDPATSVVTMSGKSFLMPLALENDGGRVDLPAGYKYSFRIQRDGRLKISALVAEWGYIWSVLCRPV